MFLIFGFPHLLVVLLASSLHFVHPKALKACISTIEVSPLGVTALIVYYLLVLALWSKSPLYYSYRINLLLCSTATIFFPMSTPLQPGVERHLSTLQILVLAHLAHVTQLPSSSCQHPETIYSVYQHAGWTHPPFVYIVIHFNHMHSQVTDIGISCFRFNNSSGYWAWIGAVLSLPNISHWFALYFNQWITFQLHKELRYNGWSFCWPSQSTSDMV